MNPTHTLEEIRQLKMSFGHEESFGGNRHSFAKSRMSSMTASQYDGIDDVSVASNSTTGTANKRTGLSKLKARKTNKDAKHMSNEMSINELTGGIMMDRQESQVNEVAMMNEKKKMLTRINDENMKMKMLIQNLQEMKVNLVNQMEELELEKDKLRAMNIDATNQSIDSYLMKDCLAIFKTDGLPPEKRKPAEEVKCPFIPHSIPF
jgi:hypothetical protein